MSGRTAERPELTRCLDYLRPGDTLVVPSLDRLSRSLQDLIELVAQLRRAGVGFRSLHESLDTTTPGGRLVFHVFAALAEFIRELIVEGTREGLDAARARGARLGRPPALTGEQVAHARDLLTNPKTSIASIARLLGVSRSTIYAALPELAGARGALRSAPRPAALPAAPEAASAVTSTSTPRAAAGPAISAAEPPVPAAEAGPSSEDRRPLRVHVPDGFIPAGVNGDKVRAVCACGWKTRARPDEQKARATMESQHGYMEPVCDLCGRDRQDHDRPYRYRYDHLEVLTDPDTGDQLLVCADDQKACRDASAQRQVHLDRAAADALGLPDIRPSLRVIPSPDEAPVPQTTSQDVVTPPADGAVEQVDGALVPQVRSGARTAKARAVWDGLNDRQQTYLTAIYRADQAKERWIRQDAAAGQTTPKAEVWRWVSFSEGSVFEAGAKTDLQRELQHAGVWDSGAGATLEALRSRGLIQVRHNRSALGSPLVDVRLTTPGRAAARAGLGVTRATRPKGLLSRGLWGQLVKAVRAEQSGRPLDSLWQQTHQYLGTGYTFRGHPSRGYLEWRGTPYSRRWYLTDTGRTHIGEHLDDYQRLYPDIDVTGLLDTVDVDHLDHDLDLTEDIGPGWRLVLRRGDLETNIWRLRHNGTETATLHFEHGPGRSLGWVIRLADGTPLPDNAPTPDVPDGSWARLRRLSAAAAAWPQSQSGREQ
jgi:DNA invertase Pin-like site-specific DNA recombinase